MWKNRQQVTHYVFHWHLFKHPPCRKYRFNTTLHFSQREASIQDMQKPRAPLTPPEHAQTSSQQRLMPRWSKNRPQAGYFQSKQTELWVVCRSGAGPWDEGLKRSRRHYFVLPGDQGNEIGQWKDCFDKLCLKLCFYFDWESRGVQNFGGLLAPACHRREQAPSSCWSITVR